MADKNVHSGHRARVKERFLRDGLDGFEKHNVLELLLFFSIPQRDTNPIAHALINRFGSLRGVFEASVEELCTVDGVSEHTATLIKLVPAAFGIAASEVDLSEKYDSFNKLGKLMLKRYAGISVETVFLVLLDNSYRIIDIVNLCEGSVNQVRFDTRRIIELCIRKNAAKAVITHNHPNGVLVPSTDDLATTEELARTFKSIHVEFLEHLLIADGKFDAILAKSEGFFWQRSDKSNFYE
ncbi:MAG: hypothetical protein IJC81_01465 [Clostridia bacterium]|nr:hypothetical protein [Clostridia bacterium]